MRMLLRFFAISCLGFGGPAVHIALLRRYLVERWGVVSSGEFSRCLGVAFLLPGPNSTQLAMLLGYGLRGGSGLVAAGVGFIAPAVALVTLLSLGYAAGSDMPWLDSLMDVVVPVVLGGIVAALVRLGRDLEEPRRGLLCAAAAALATWGGAPPVFALGVGAGLGLFARKPRALLQVVRSLPNWCRSMASGRGNRVAATLASAIVVVASLVYLQDATLLLVQQGGAAGLVALVLVLAAYSLTIFGSGYLFLAYAEHGLVERLGLIGSEDLLAAVAIAETAPGPLFAVGAAIGTITNGVGGAVAGTVGVFTPAFLLAYGAGRCADRVGRSPVARRVAWAIGSAALGVIAMTVGVAIAEQLAAPATAALFLLALVASIALRVPIGAMVLLTAGTWAALRVWP